jgi:hypothetical protein
MSYNTKMFPLLRTVKRESGKDEYDDPIYTTIPDFPCNIQSQQNENNDITKIVIYSPSQLVPKDEIEHNGKWYVINSVSYHSGFQSDFFYWKGELNG